MLKQVTNYINQKLKQTMGKTETEFLPAVMETVQTPPSPTGRILLWTFFALIAITVTWVIVGHVDEVAVAPGKIIPVGYVKVIQAEDKGIVRAIHIQDGETVKKGQLLLEMDPTISAADLARIKKQVGYYNLELQRLEAERSNTAFIPKVEAEMDASDVAYQMQLYQSDIAQYNAKIAASEANIQQSLASLEVARVNRAKNSALLQINQEQEKRIDKLVKEDIVSDFTLLSYQSKRIETEQTVSGLNSEIARLEATVANSIASKAAVEAQRINDIDTHRVDTRKQWMAYSEELKKAQEKETFSRIVAPVDGRVTQLAIHTVGGIVTAAQALMIIVPDDVSLEVEAWVANKDIGFIALGQKAEVKVETFNFQKYGTLDAVVTRISADAQEDKDKGRGYTVALELDQKYVNVNGAPVYLSPGMTATAEIKIRKKRIIEFFLDPFKQYQSEALRER